MDGSGYQELEAGVYAGLVLASAATTPQPGGADASKAVVHYPATASSPPASDDSSSSRGVCTPTDCCAVKPAGGAIGSDGSRRRLTSLSIRSAGCNDDFDEARTTVDDSRARLRDHDDDGDGNGTAMGLQRHQHQHQQPYPTTPGSTAHTGSTSSFSSVSIASMNNVPREGTARVPDTRSIVDLATVSVTRVNAAKIELSPSSASSTCSGGSLSSSRRSKNSSSSHACASPPIAAADKLRRRREPPRSEPPPPPLPIVLADRGCDRAKRYGAGPGLAPRIYSDVAETLAREEESAARASAAAAAAAEGAADAGAGAAAAWARPSLGAGRRSSSSLVCSRQERWQHFVVEGGNLRRAAAPDSASAGRPVLNPYRTTAKKASGGSSHLPRQLPRGGGARSPRYAWQHGTSPGVLGRRSRKLRVEPGSEGWSPLASSPRACSSGSPRRCSVGGGGGTAVEWIWPSDGVRRRPPSLSGPRHRAGFGAGSAASSREVSPRSSRFSSSSVSCSSPSSFCGSRSCSLGPATPSGWGRGGDDTPDSDDDDNTISLFPPFLSGEPCDLQRESALPAAAVAAPGAAATTSGGGPTSTTPANRGVSSKEAFLPDGFGGWAGPLTSAPLPPRSAGAASFSRAPACASSLPSASSCGKPDAGGSEDGDDRFDIAPLPTRFSAHARRGSISTRTAARSSRGGDTSHGNGIPGRMSRAAASQSAAAGEGGQWEGKRGVPWWRAVRGLCVDGEVEEEGEPSPVQSCSAFEDDSSFLNPFSPASSRRFSSSAADAGVRGRYGSGGSGGIGGGGSSRAAAAASRFSTQFLHPIAEFCSEARFAGCVFGGDGDGDASDEEEEEEDGVAREQLERKQEEEVGREIERGARRKIERDGPGGGPDKGGNGGGGRSSPFPLRVPSAGPYPLPGNTWPLPIAVSEGKGGGGGSAGREGDAGADAVGTKSSTTSYSTAPMSPGPSAFSVRSVCSARPAPASAAAVATASARAAASAAALAKQASVAADAAAATAKHARNACKLNDCVDAPGGAHGPCNNPWPPLGRE